MPLVSVKRHLPQRCYQGLCGASLGARKWLGASGTASLAALAREAPAPQRPGSSTSFTALALRVVNAPHNTPSSKPAA